jgi:chlorite dismutase
MPDLSPVPLTLEGSSVLHQMFRFRRREWRALPAWHRERMIHEATSLFTTLEQGQTEGHPNQSAIYSEIGHKGDLMLIHFRDSFADLNQTELALARLELFDFLEQTHSYLSVVELGLYESSIKTYAGLAERGVEPHSPEWNEEIKQVISRQTAAMAPRLFPSIPPAKYLCFYPMDRKRGEKNNWYTASMPERQRMMHDHGMIGRRYADEVRQIITGSIGFDDWEWGVDLFADDPLVFKHLIYEMRFDEASALYAEFGTFYVGVRLAANTLVTWLHERQH